MNITRALDATTATTERAPSRYRLRRGVMLGLLYDPRAQELSRRAHALLKQLVVWHDPLTGHLPKRDTYNATLSTILRYSPTTLSRARRELIDRGLLIGYQPGDGRAGGRYVIARSWQEAEQAAAARAELGDAAPYWPPLPARPTVTRTVPDVRVTADQRAAEQAAAPQQRRQRKPAAPPVAQPPMHVPAIDVDVRGRKQLSPDELAPGRAAAIASARAILRGLTAPDDVPAPDVGHVA